MAAPNLKSPTTITGKTLPYVATDTLVSVLSNAAASGTALRVNTIRACNTATGSVTVDISFRRSGVDYYQFKDFPLDAKSSNILVNRDELIWVEENDAIWIKAGANSALHITISYEVIA